MHGVPFLSLPPSAIAVRVLAQNLPWTTGSTGASRGQAGEHVSVLAQPLHARAPETHRTRGGEGRTPRRRRFRGAAGGNAGVGVGASEARAVRSQRRVRRCEHISSTCGPAPAPPRRRPRPPSAPPAGAQGFTAAPQSGNAVWGRAARNRRRRRAPRRRAPGRQPGTLASVRQCGAAASVRRA